MTKSAQKRGYYISSIEVNAEEFARCVRGHWAIESMHRYFDVTFHEDTDETLDEQAALFEPWKASMENGTVNTPKSSYSGAITGQIYPFKNLREQVFLFLHKQEKERNYT